ncbi:SagB/ThcOx family dehydrogenase [Lactococcus muris]|uniref:SagB/ThcOx family dehydrogenase n=1 Tax=Lactococcus muris TaxID=2941330 RepID=UPI00203CCA2C|nr:SagB/ThcOx family dehydrogenase [Lactococcus muris]
MDDFKAVMISNHYANKLVVDDSLYQTFHQNTKHSKKYLLKNMYQSRKLLNSSNFHEATQLPEKYFPLAESFSLKEPTHDVIYQCLNERKSQVTRPIKDITLTDQVISDLFWSGYGKNKKNTRVVPSGGALYPLELYALILESTESLSKGLYHYSPSKHEIQLIRDDEKVFNTSDYIMMDNIKYSSVIFFITAIFKRNTFKYDARAYRYTLIESGAMAQNISLMATKYHLVSTYFGGVDDYEVEKILSVDGKRESLVNCLFISKEGEWNGKD